MLHSALINTTPSVTRPKFSAQVKVEKVGHYPVGKQRAIQEMGQELKDKYGHVPNLEINIYGYCDGTTPLGYVCHNNLHAEVFYGDHKHSVNQIKKFAISEPVGLFKSRVMGRIDQSLRAHS